MKARPKSKAGSVARRPEEVRSSSGNADQVKSASPKEDLTSSSIAASFGSAHLTAMELSVSASMVSSSKLITSIFSLMHCSAALVHRASRSAPTYP
ncbi:hypothetical protein Q3G72_007532 [Acer saccharum]|nr:hypothetical protein Q3G72_007532 [Acer saccharum]